jgi:CRISPR-associated protein Csy1
MSNVETEKSISLRTLVHSFVKERLDAKLEKLDDDDPKRAEVIEQHNPSAWLSDAARRAVQLQAVTHALKPIHPDAKGTSIYAPPLNLPPHAWVGTHCLGLNFDGDVVGNAAALDVYKLLQKTNGSRSLLQLAVESDESFSKALSNNQDEAKDWMRSFASLTQAKDKVSSHTLAKQLYWPTGGDSQNDADFHLLAPLYATSLAHRVFTTVQSHRFSDNAKAAREARKKGEYSDFATHDYLGTAVQNLGGTKPQNISQLNSVRGGKNLLLASLPPMWKSSDTRPLLSSTSMFPTFARRNEVRKQLFELTRFLKTNPEPVKATRDFVNIKIATVVDEFFNFSADYRDLPSGWSLSPECNLGLVEKIWLDTEAVVSKLRESSELIPDDVPAQICKTFANWLNSRLKKQGFATGDVEAFEWSRYVLARISTELKEWSDEDTSEL